MIRVMDEDLDDDDHIGTGLVDLKKMFLERLDLFRREFEEVRPRPGHFFLLLRVRPYILVFCTSIKNAKNEQKKE